MINLGSNPFLSNSMGFMGGAGGGASAQNQMMMAMQMMQTFMQMLNMVMGAMSSMGSMGLPMSGGFGGMGGGGGAGLTDFLGTAPSLADGGSASPSLSGGSAPSVDFGTVGATSTGASPVGAPAGGIAGITPYQGDLPNADKWSMCGLVAAQGMARSLGNTMPMSEIKNIASSNGYYNNGMKGPQSEVNLLNKMGIPAHMESGNLDWNKVAKTVQAGRPVILDTEQHYFVIEGYDPSTGKFDLGNSARAMKASNGNTKYTPQEIVSVFGARCTPRSLIFADAPLPGGAGQGQAQAA